MNIKFYIYDQPEYDDRVGTGIYSKKTTAVQLALINQVGSAACAFFDGDHVHGNSYTFPSISHALEHSLSDATLDVAVFVSAYSIMNRGEVSASTIKREIERSIKQYDTAAMFAAFTPNVGDAVNGLNLNESVFILNMSVFKPAVPSDFKYVASNDVAVSSNVLSFDDTSNPPEWVRGFPIPTLLSAGFGSGLVKVVMDAGGTIVQLSNTLANAFIHSNDADKFAKVLPAYIGCTPANAPIVRTTESVDGYKEVADKTIDVLVHPAIGIGPFLAWASVAHTPTFTTILTPADVIPVSNDFIVWEDLVASWDGTQAGYNGIMDKHIGVLTKGGSWYAAGYTSIVSDACKEMGWTEDQFVENWKIYQQTNFMYYDANITTSPNELLVNVPEAAKRGAKCLIYTGNAFMSQYTYFQSNVSQLQKTFLEVFGATRYTVVGVSCDSHKAVSLVLR